MASEKSFYTKEEYDLIIETLRDSAIAQMLGVIPVYVTRSPSEIKVYHGIVSENGKTSGEVTIVGKRNDLSEKEEPCSSLIYASPEEQNRLRMKKTLDSILDLNKIKVV